MGNVSVLKKVTPESSTTLQMQPRILSIDVLRGFALFGIFYVHMIFWYSGGPLPINVYQTYTDIPSIIAIAFNFIFFNSKFFSLFSFLFGLSFYIQIKGLTAKHDNAALRFIWRLIILGAIGVIHHAFRRGDILTIYVPLGFLLLFARNLSNTTILLMASLLILNIPTKIIEIVSILTQGKPEFIPDTYAVDSAHYFVSMNQSSFTEVVAYNMQVIKEKFYFLMSTGRLFITFGFFLLGMLAGRLKWFEDLETSSSFFKTVWKKAGIVLIAAVVISLIMGITVYALSIDVKNAPWIRWLSGSLIDVMNASLTILYMTSIALLMLKPTWYARLTPLSYVGKMALTAYLSQSLFGVLLFFHFGLGLFLMTSPAMNILICCSLFFSQILFCKYWLSRFNYGPIEWLWRSATYLKWQRLVKG